ncbi:MAG: PaaI family thioesterase [Clostridia bacterium]|nr:PaaI family thioesterase [Clostridia bacterium]
MLTLEQMKMIMAKDRYATEQTGIVIDEIGPDTAVCSMQITPQHKNAYGTVMGGAIFTLADLCFAAAANNSGEYIAMSFECNITFLRATRTGTLHATAVPLKMGKNLCFYRIDITDDEGTLTAQASVTGSRQAVGQK